MASSMKRFARTTSMKGVPRIVTSETTFLTVVWTFFVLIFFVSCVYQICLLLADYYEYPTIREITVKMVDGQNYVGQPRITLCNLNPTQSSVENISLKTNHHLNGKSLSEVLSAYSEALERNTNCQRNCSQEDETTLEIIRKELSATVGLNQFIGVEMAKTIGHQQDSFLASCSVAYKKGVSDVHLPCGDNLEVTPIFSPTMSNCFSVDIPTNSSDSDYGKPSGLSFILYLDNLMYKNDNVRFDEHASLGTVGAFLELSSRSEKQLQSDQWITLEPGSHTTVRYDVKVIHDLPKPYGICVPPDSEDTSDLFRQYCLDKCVTEGLQILCGCTDYSEGILFDSDDDYPFCGNSSLHWDVLLKFHRCTTRNRKSLDLGGCSEKCKFPCDNYQFTMKRTESKFPMKNTMESFWETMVSKPPIGKKLKPHLKTSLNHSETPATEKDMKETIIKENFLKVTVKLGSRFLTVERVRQKYNIANTLSAVGAALNFWSGITVFIFVEFLELFYRMIKSNQTGGKAENTNTKPEKTIPKESENHGPETDETSKVIQTHI